MAEAFPDLQDQIALITGGKAEISGSFTQEEAQNLANMLSYGALPLTFKESSVSTVSPALGGEQLHAGLIAGANRQVGAQNIS